MHSRINILLIASLTMLSLLAGCTKVQTDVDMQESIEYVLAVGTAQKSKSLVTGTAYPTTETFVSSAYYLPAGKTWAVNKAEAVPYLENIEISYQAPVGSAVNGTWRNSSTSYFWPAYGSLTFFAYSPTGIGATISSNGVAISNYNVAANQDKDFMVAMVSKDQTGNTSNISGSAQNGVPTVFQHKLARVLVKAMLDQTPADITQTYAVVKSVKFTNIYSTGSYNTDDIWVPIPDSAGEMVISSSDITITSSTAVIISASSQGALVLPQRHDVKSVKSRLVVEYCVYKDGTLITDYTDGSANGVFSITLDDLSSTYWRKNDFITYTLMLNTDRKPIRFTTDTEDWGTGSGDMDILTY